MAIKESWAGLPSPNKISHFRRAGLSVLAASIALATVGCGREDGNIFPNVKAGYPVKVTDVYRRPGFTYNLEPKTNLPKDEVQVPETIQFEGIQCLTLDDTPADGCADGKKIEFSGILDGDNIKRAMRFKGTTISRLADFVDPQEVFTRAIPAEDY